METVKLYDYQIDFVKELLRGFIGSKHADRDTRLMASDVLNQIDEQHPDKVYEISLLTGELIEINIK